MTSRRSPGPPGSGMPAGRGRRVSEPLSRFAPEVSEAHLRPVPPACSATKTPQDGAPRRAGCAKDKGGFESGDNLFSASFAALEKLAGRGRAAVDRNTHHRTLEILARISGQRDRPMARSLVVGAGRQEPVQRRGRSGAQRAADRNRNTASRRSSWWTRPITSGCVSSEARARRISRITCWRCRAMAAPSSVTDTKLRDVEF